METADMVKVAVSAAPYSIDKPYSYLVPESLAAAAVPGVRVMVPFGRGNKESEGLILARVQEPKLPGSKAIRQILDPEPVLDKAGIRWQICEMGKIDAGGGGTVAQFMANRNITTLDAGVPVLSMHAPFEVVAKLDCYETYRACKALYEAL